MNTDEDIIHSSRYVQKWNYLQQTSGMMINFFYLPVWNMFDKCIAKQKNTETDNSLNEFKSLGYNTQLFQRFPPTQSAQQWRIQNLN